MEFRILGPLEAHNGERPVAIGQGRQRAVLVLLLLHRNAPVSSERLIDALWGAQPPATVATLVHGYVSRLRKMMGHDAIATGPAGYTLTVAPGSLDADVFVGLADEGRTALAAGDHRAAAAVLQRALALWRGPALADFAFDAFAQLDIARLEELRLGVLESRIDAELALGRHGRLVAELEQLVVQHPLREHLRGQLMLALYRSGRQVEALALYRQTHATLADELGIEPAPELQQLERAILGQDVALDVAPEAMPPLRPGARGLPDHGTSFVGRDRELAALQVLLGRPDARLVTLTGPGGAGKTRLAVEATRALPGPAAFVDLSAIRDAGVVAGAIAGTLGLREVAPEDALPALVSHLRGSRRILVLDNFEQVLAAAPVVDALLAGVPELAIVVTSRAPLRLVGEQVLVVPPLELPARGLDIGALIRTEAVELFVDRARLARPEFALTEANGGDVAGGLPLALELAAARVVLLSPRAIVSRLGRWLDLLKSRAPELPDRHRSLRATIEWSYDLLLPQEQRLLASLAVFVGGFTVDAADAVAAGSGTNVVDGVESLLAANLLRADGAAGEEPRFGMLETIHEYAAERLCSRADAEELRGRHASFYAALADDGERALRDRQQSAFLDRLDADVDNLRAAIGWAASGGDADVGLRLAASLWRYWQIRGRLAEGRASLEALLARRAGSRLGRAAAQLSAGRCAFMQSDLDAVERYVALCLPTHRRAGDLYSVCFALSIRGLAASGRGDHDAALRFLAEALSAASSAGDTWTRSFALAESGLVHAAAGNATAGRRALEEGLRGLREVGDARSAAWVLMQLGRLALEAGDLDRARTRLEQALAAQRALEDRWGIVYSLGGLASVALRQGALEAARGLLTESLDVAGDTLERPGLAASLELLGRLATARRQSAHAAALYACASVLRDVASVHPFQIDQSAHACDIAQVRAQLGDERFAEAWAEGRAMTLDEVLAYARRDEVHEPEEAVDV
jgi:predicted ATPase/DNA-binding SARP family transcriptional activator